MTKHEKITNKNTNKQQLETEGSHYQRLHPPAVQHLLWSWVSIRLKDTHAAVLAYSIKYKLYQ